MVLPIGYFAWPIAWKEVGHSRQFDDLSSKWNAERKMAPTGKSGKTRKRRKRGPRFAEIASEAGVSQATVDRVLNERESVSEATRRKVLLAAQRLGVPRVLPQPDHGLVHLDILLPRNETPFFRRLGEALRDAAAMLDRRVIIHRTIIAEGDDEAMAAAIRKPPYRRAGFVLAAPDVSAIREAVGEAVTRGEKAVVAVSDLTGLQGPAYVGIDNCKAGAVAGDLMGRITFTAGRVIVLGSSPAFRAHADREAGFREALGRFPHLRFDLAEASTRDEAGRCFRAVNRALAGGGDPVVGIYNSGAGSEGIARALALYRGPRPNWIGHEISEDHVAYMRQGTMDVAIDQDPAGQAVAALQSLLHMVGVTDRPPARLRGELRIYTKSVLP